MTANGGPLPPRDHDSDQVLAALQPGCMLVDPNAEWPTIPADVNPDDVDAEALWAAWVDAGDEQ